MSGWESYYKTEGDEEAEEEQEENLEASGDYKYSGRDSLIFLVDASKAMFESQSEDELTPFDMSIQCIQSVYISKIISSDRDLLAVVFYGTEKDKNSVNFKNIYVLQELDNPGAKRILELDQFKGQQGQKRFQDLMGHGSDYSLSEVLWVCANLFSDVQFKMSHKRIMLFTNEDNPHGNDSAKASRARTKAGDLRDTGIFLDLMHLKKPGGFDISLFYRDIISIAEDEDLRVHFEESSKLEDLLRKVRAKETRKRALSRLKLKLNKDIVISVGVYNLVQKALKPPPIKLYRETNEPVKTKTRTFNTSTGGLLLPSDTKRSQIYGSRQIILEKEETEELKRFDDPGLMLMGFKPLVLLKKHHYLRPSLFVYPEESLVIGSSTLFSALLIKCLEKEVAALCRYTPRRNIPPYFVALVPQDEELDDQKIQVTPPGFQLVFLPFADDKRKMPFTEKIMATPEQVDKMKAIVEKLRFTYRSDSFENPVLQQHFRNLEALALDLMEPEQAVDLTLPKVEAMNKRLGSLVDEFKELVYPPDYNPEGKVTKRKHDNDGSGSKRPKVEYSEEELKTHISKGTLGKFTVPMLKEACRAYGLKSGLKKQELLEALTKHFQD
ncbi:X-ray repair cross-complementing protein 6 [Macaca nemestrina]|uniref:X-ray repair cross-complementing protein 6 n=11 Tax=Cercopithecidae TaxID=9527 RepID=H9ET71_MACMU|nr:X-ray repair cross-complementing protein 6 [Macaca fascicularis]XP_007974110.1 X-ray repair cross-complementing protein 6 [Chlorocebus sabaeus]XP_009215653.2 X-ray repair cross-complementing protein 6 [Papio anubis]XP_009215654.2 X-ray repair cross-complementing protein 6 [Papio anubis]XP_010373664.1 X-ray repair cross-complementing protein 6 [Rhinopithecus roxellana]XP_011710505.1 X-ray repair cross-complementing protein 6 [Macaca nemestrina]XP_011710506.1 X-ray repair cross-complementing